MFHYRWHHTADIQKSSRVLPNWFGGPVDDDRHAAMAAEFSQRQIGRLRYVGSNAQTAPIIERGYQRLIAILERHFAVLPFLFGRRPGAADFALHGQLTQLACFDPTPMALTTSTAPRVVAWVHGMEDLSGLEPADDDWLPLAQLPGTVRELSAEIGRLYAPLLLANARALQAGEDKFSAVIDDQLWQQQAFAYQAKCLQWLRAQHRALPVAQRKQFDAALHGTGCDVLFG
jgi:hypothetical protein